MKALDNIVARACSAPARIVLPEGNDPRIAKAALRAAQDGMAKPTLIGDRDTIVTHLGEGATALDIMERPDPALAEKLAASLYDLRRAKGMSQEDAAKEIEKPLSLGAMLVKEGHADGMVAGAVHTTADTIAAALRIIGRGPGAKSISSFFIIAMPDERTYIFSDCGLIVEPTAAQLSQIAIASAGSYAELLMGTPKVAMLSFSTKGSATHERIDKVTEALALAKTAAPNLMIDGELQFDAAIVPEVAASKAPGSDIAGDANVLIFPNLEAGNIGYKIAQRLGGAAAIGPILQGLARPANDLSRGCTEDDVYHMIAVTVAQAATLS